MTRILPILPILLLAFSCLAQPSPINRRAMAIAGLATTPPQFPYNVTPQVIRDWYYVDVTNNVTVSNQWLDRIVSARMWQMDTTKSPTNSSSGIRFNGGKYLTNVSLSFGQTGSGDAYSLFLVYQFDSSPATEMIAGDADGGGQGLFVNTSSQLQWFGVSGSPNTAALTPNVLQDVLVVGTNNGAITRIYTNGVLAVSGTGGNPTGGIMEMGGGTGGFTFKGYVLREVLWDLPMPPAQVAIPHQWRTNTLGGSP